MAESYVNVFDVVDCVRRGVPVPRFESREELSWYMRGQEGKVMLRGILGEVKAPSLMYVMRGMKGGLR